MLPDGGFRKISSGFTAIFLEKTRKIQENTAAKGGIHTKKLQAGQKKDYLIKVLAIGN
jgi:hypothetical protein